MKEEKHKFWSSLTWPLVFVVAIWVIFILGKDFDLQLYEFGIYPQRTETLTGILTYPFVHGSWEHLFNNSVPLLVLGWALFRFYRSLAWKTVFWIWLMSGLWLWIAGRSSYHIGASGIIYGLAAFLFISGWLRREKRVAAVSLLVAFLYGGMWWGVLPVKPDVSWEGHLWGAIAGILVAIALRKQGPQKPKYSWEFEEEEEDEDMDHEGFPNPNRNYPPPPRYLRVKYHYQPESPRNSDKAKGNNDRSDKPNNPGKSQ